MTASGTHRVEEKAIQILLFAQCKECVGQPEIQWPINKPITVAQLLDALAERYPRLTALRGVLAVAVNEKYAQANTTISIGDEVALLPPVSGG